MWRFKLAIPPQLQGKSLKERKAYIKQVVRNADAKFRKDRGNKPALGVKKIMMQRPLSRPKNPSFSPRTKFFTSDKAREEELKEGYHQFASGYRGVFHSYRTASARQRRPVVEWPEGSYPPSCLYPVAFEKAA